MQSGRSDVKPLRNKISVITAGAGL